MFPLKIRKLIRGAAAHIAAGLGAAADYVANYVDLFSPFDGIVEIYTGVQGGNWLRLIRPNGDKVEFAHLSQYKVINGAQVKAGQLIAETGNTGTITTGPHLHIQIFREGKRLDPEKYNWEDVILPPMTCELEKEEIRKLNFELGVVTPQRDKALVDLAQEKLDHAEDVKQKLENYNNWQAELDKRKKAEALIAQVKLILGS